MLIYMPKSKSDIYLLVKYWRLKNTVWEPFLSITSESDFFQAWSFRIMLMNYKNFHFTKVPDKTKKVQKPCFWAIFDQFWSFLPNGDFFKKIWLSHVTIYGPPNTMLSFRKNKWANSEKSYKQKEGWTDGRKDDEPYFVGPFLPRSRGPIKKPENRFKVKRTPYHFCSKMTKLLWIRFLLEKPLMQFPCLSWPLSLCKIVKQSLQRIQCCETECDILSSKWPICPKQEFFG